MFCRTRVVTIWIWGGRACYWGTGPGHQSCQFCFKYNQCLFFFNTILLTVVANNSMKYFLKPFETLSQRTYFWKKSLFGCAVSSPKQVRVRFFPNRTDLSLHRAINSKILMTHSMTKPTKWPVPSLTRIFAVHMKKPWVLSYPLSTQRRLIRLSGCTGWSWVFAGCTSFCCAAAHL